MWADAAVMGPAFFPLDAGDGDRDLTDFFPAGDFGGIVIRLEKKKDPNRIRCCMYVCVCVTCAPMWKRSIIKKVVERREDITLQKHKSVCQSNSC
jgi:hypothetical protein